MPAVTVPVFIGDRLTAAGFRLAGLRPLVTSPDEVAEVFREALDAGGPIFITASCAGHLPPATLDRAVTAASPPVAVIPDFAGGGEPRDLSRRVRQALGVET